jgi:hypothetical protein
VCTHDNQACGEFRKSHEFEIKIQCARLDLFSVLYVYSNGQINSNRVFTTKIFPHYGVSPDFERRQMIVLFIIHEFVKF